MTREGIRLVQKITKNWPVIFHSQAMNVRPYVCCVPFCKYPGKICHSETCFRLALCAVQKNVTFWNMFQIDTVQTSSYQSRMLNARSWSIRPSFCICLFVFSYECRDTTNAMSPRYDSLHSVNLKHVSEWHIFQNGTQCQSETCFRMAHFSERHTMPIWNMFQNGTCFRTLFGDFGLELWSWTINIIWSWTINSLKKISKSNAPGPYLKCTCSRSVEHVATCSWTGECTFWIITRTHDLRAVLWVVRTYHTWDWRTLEFAFFVSE